MEKIKEILSEILKNAIENSKSPGETRDEIIKKLAFSGINAATVDAVISFFFSNFKIRNHSKRGGIRVFHSSESLKLNMEAQGFLIDLFHNRMINRSDFEEIMDLIRENEEQMDLADILSLLEYYLGYKSGEDPYQPASLYLN